MAKSPDATGQDSGTADYIVAKHFLRRLTKARQALEQRFQFDIRAVDTRRPEFERHVEH